MSPGFNSTNTVPCNGMALASRNSKVAMWANPAFVIFGSKARGGLNRVFDTALKLGSLSADSNSFEVKWLEFGAPLGTAVATRFHQYQLCSSECAQAPQGFLYLAAMYFTPQRIWVCGFVIQSGPSVAIFSPGSDCGIP